MTPEERQANKERLYTYFEITAFLRIQQEREEIPEAFLFSKAESDYLDRAADSLTKSLLPFDEQAKGSPELINIIIEAVTAGFKQDKIAIQELERLTARYKGAFYWTIDNITFNIPKKNIPTFKIKTSNPGEFPERIVTEKDLPEFYSAPNTRERARALGLPDLYLYVDKSDLQKLEVLHMFLADFRNAGTVSPELQKGVLTLLSSSVLNVINNIGAAAKKPKKSKKLNEQGRQISVFEFEDINGVELTLTENTDKGTSLSVGDPNTDKLLKQALSLTLRDKKQEGIIPIKDFMEFRKLSDRKTAIEKADNATDGIFYLGFRVIEETEDFYNKDLLRFFDKCRLHIEKGRGGSYIQYKWSEDIYRHIMRLCGAGKQIMSSDPRIMYIPDNRRIAYNIANKMEENSRTNAGRRNSHVLSVRTLINCCHALPLYPESAADKGKENYLRFQSEAPERIIKPFIKDLDFITAGTQKDKTYQILKAYRFKKAKGSAVSSAELREALKDYTAFIELYIEYEFTEEPDYTNLIESKQKQKEKAEAAAAKRPGRSKGKKKNTAKSSAGNPGASEQTPPKITGDVFGDL